MIPISSEQVDPYREHIGISGDRNLNIDIGYFLTWYAASEMGITNLLAIASEVKDFDVFDALTSGMDVRTKIERFRKICKHKAVIGPNLNERLSYVDSKARPLRNRLSHSFIGVNQKRPNTYFASTLATLPWNELGEKRPDWASKKTQPHAIPAEVLLGWGGWLAQFTTDLSSAFQHFMDTREFEIIDPKTMIVTGQ
jgi:hypothetical protein